MSDYQIQPDSGFLHRNKFHKKGERTPAAKGKCAVVCRGCGAVHELEIAVWEPKEPGKGSFFKLQDPRPKDGAAPAQNQQQPAQAQQQQAPPPAPPKPEKPVDRKSLLR